MSESKTRKAKYPDLYGTPDCPGAGLRSPGFSKGRGYGTIGARHAGRLLHGARCLSVDRRRGAARGRRAPEEPSAAAARESYVPPPDWSP